VKTDEPIKMPFGVWTVGSWGPGNLALFGDPDSPLEGILLRLMLGHA